MRVEQAKQESQESVAGLKSETKKDALAREAAIAYYVQNQTMDNIRRRMGVSRSTVSRLLAYAREKEIVQITVRPAPSGRHGLVKQFQEHFGVRLYCVETPRGATPARRLEMVAKVGGQLLDQIVVSGATVGFAWGNTTSEVVRFLKKRELDGVTVVQLNGAASVETSGIAHVAQILSIPADRWNAGLVQFPVPAFFDHASTREAMWKEGAVRRVLGWQNRCDIAVFGVGGFRADVPSHVYASGYLSSEEITLLEKDGVVGDVCTVLLRQNGTWRDIPLNQRATGPLPDKLKRIERRLAVASGSAKAFPLLGALRAGVATDVVCDRELAELVIELERKGKFANAGAEYHAVKSLS